MNRSAKRSAFSIDLAKYYWISNNGNRSAAASLRLWLLNSDFHCVCCFRYGQAVDRIYRRSRAAGLLPVISHRVWSRYVAAIHHTNIDKNAQIGPGFYLMHRNGVFIGPSRIGSNCVIHHNVTIGERVSGGDHSVPELGDNVWIGPGAILSGGIRVGNGVTIAAGTVLSKSVPDRCLVVGNPGRVVQQDYDNTELINFQLPLEAETAAEPDLLPVG